MEENKDWKILAMESQFQFFETLGSRSFDEIEKSNVFLLKKKIGFATCGKPSELPTASNYFTGYKQEELDHIKPLCSKIIEKSDCDPVKFACTILILYHKGALRETPVFRLVTQSGNIFIDTFARIYTTWVQFMEENKLPDCEYCYPIDGMYSSDKELLVGFAKSPASGFVSKATNCLDTAGSLVSVAAASVFAAGLIFSVAPAALAAAGTTAACTGVYCISRSVGSLYDRRKHEQSIGLKDQESRSAWLSVGSSLASVATFEALGKAKKVVESGESLSKLSAFGLHALTASSLVFSGFGFVDSLFVCTDKYNKGVLTKKEVFDLSCELLFLFDAIASTKATTNLINNMYSVAKEATVTHGKITRTQKRKLHKTRTGKKGEKIPSTSKSGSAFSQTETKSITAGFSTAVQLLLFHALKAYIPRIEEIVYFCQSIGHDIISWKSSEITDVVFLNNLAKNLLELYIDFKNEVSEAVSKLIKYFNSVKSNDVINEVHRLFLNTSVELKSVFCSKIINLEDEIDSLINEAEQEIFDLYEHLGLEQVESLPEDDSFHENVLNPEAQSLLSSCGNVASHLCWPCDDLKDFENILEGVKNVVVDEFKAKVQNYKKTLEAAKSASGGLFDLKTFHKALNIEVDVGQHMFNETIQSLSAECTIYKIKNKCRDIENRRESKSTPIWEGLTEGLFHYYGPSGTGSMSKSDLLSVVSSVLKMNISEENCKLFESKNDVVLIEVLANDQTTTIHVVVYQNISELNTSSGIIVVIT